VKLKRQLSPSQPKPLLLSNFRVDDDDSIIVDDDVVFGRNRHSREFGQLIHEDNELSDSIKLRLALARAKAMQKYQEKWG
jgi:hypothetical protein